MKGIKMRSMFVALCIVCLIATAAGIFSLHPSSHAVPAFPLSVSHPWP